MGLVVTGASGFIGQYVVKEAVKRGWDTIAVSRSSCKRLSGVTYLAVDSYLDTPPGDFIIHLAEDNNVVAHRYPESVEQDMSVVRALLKKSKGHVIYISSSLVYGVGYQGLLTEEAPLLGATHYARQKILKEMTILDNMGTVVRISNVYGHGISRGSVIDDIIRQLCQEGPIVLRNLAPVRDFLLASDAARAICDLVQFNEGGIFNVGTGTGHSIGKLAKMIIDVSGQPNREVVGTTESCNTDVNILSSIKMTRSTGWTHKYNLREGLVKILKRRQQEK